MQVIEMLLNFVFGIEWGVGTLSD